MDTKYPSRIVWTALDQSGFRCTLQHYNPLIDLKVEERYAIPSDWQLKGQLVFGNATGPPAHQEKAFNPVGDRVIVQGSVVDDQRALVL